MEGLGPFFVLGGAVFLAWLIIGLYGRNTGYMQANVGRYVVVLLVLLGLFAGLVVKSVTSNQTALYVVILAVVLAVLAELSRMF